VTPKEAALWMVEQLKELEYLDQDYVAGHLECEAPELTYINDNGNTAIDKRVLVEFNKITPDVVWSRGSRQWRYREEYDDPDQRMQD
jgi:hypothetical protein